MDNDKQVANNHPEINLFLRGDLFPKAQGVFDRFNFETEFEKSQKNKNLIVTILLFAAIVLSVGITVGVSTYLTQKNKEITITINSFQDLNLKKLLASFQRVKNNLDELIAERDTLKNVFQSAMQEAGFTRSTALVLLSSMLLNDEERNNQLKSIESEYTKKTNDLEIVYNKQVADINKKIDLLQTEVNSLKTPELEKAYAEQSTLDPREQVFALEKQKLVQSFERQIEEQRTYIANIQKQAFENQRNAVNMVSQQFQAQIQLLDPVITDTKATALTAQAVAQQLPEVTLSAITAPELLAVENENLKKIQSNMDAIDYLSHFLLEIPQKNSIPQFVAAIKNSAASVGGSVKDIITASLAERKIVQKELNELKTDQEVVLGGIKRELKNTQVQLAATEKKLTDTTAKYSEVSVKNTELSKVLNSSNDATSTLTRQNAALTTQLEGINAKTTDLNNKLTTANSKLLELQKGYNEVNKQLKIAEAEASIKSQMENYLVYLVNQTQEPGFIVDVGDRKSFLIQLQPDMSARMENRTVYIFSLETKTLLGSAIIRKKGSNFYAYPENSSLGPKVTVGDLISLTSTRKN